MARSSAETIVSSAEASVGSVLVPERLATWGWVLGYTAVLSSLSELRYHLWLATGFDLGLYKQGLWLLAHRGTHAVSTYTGHPILAHAASYILIPLAPLYKVGGVGFLFALQAFALGLGYFFIRRIGRTIGVDEGSSHIVGVIYMIYPTILGTNLFDFHPDALGVPIFFGLIWAALEERWGLYLLLLLASLLIKDTVSLLLMGTGVVLVIERRLNRGLLTCGLAALAAYLDIQVVIPSLTHAGVPQWQSYYGHLGATPLAGLLQLVRHPLLLVDWAGSGRAWACLAVLFAPFLVILLVLRTRALTPWWIPGLALCEANLVSPDRPLSSPFSHAFVLAVPFFFAAVLAGLHGCPRAHWSRRSMAAWVVLPVLSLAAFVWHEYWTHWKVIRPDIDALQAAVEAVPEGVPVLTQNFIAAHLAERAQEWTIEAREGRSAPAGTYVVLGPLETGDIAPRSLTARLHAALGSGTQADVIFSRGGVAVYRLRQSLPWPSAGGGR